MCGHGLATCGSLPFQVIDLTSRGVVARCNMLMVVDVPDHLNSCFQLVPRGAPQTTACWLNASAIVRPSSA